VEDEMRRELVRALMAVTILASPIMAQSPLQQDTRPLYKRCTDRVSEDQIKACSDLIWEGPPNGERLSAYNYRAVAYQYLGRDKLAFTDYNTLIGLNAHNSWAWAMRGTLFANLDDYATALQDFNRALEIAPNSTLALQGRGIVRLVQGDAAAAAKDFQTAVEINADEPIAQLWRYIANARLGHANDSSLVRVAEPLQGGIWPEPIFTMFLGQSDAKAVMAFKKSSFIDVARVQPCQAAFFSAEHLLFEGSTAEATKLFANAVENCPRDLLEYTAAKGELRRLQP
jgi:lipoprotein NlpI